MPVNEPLARLLPDLLAGHQMRQAATAFLRHWEFWRVRLALQHIGDRQLRW